MLETIIREPTETAKAAIVWLHGLGASGDDFAPIAPLLQQHLAKPMRFIFPHAPVRPVSLNMGMSMRAWFDIIELSLDADFDEAGVLAIEKEIFALLDQQIELGIEPENLFLAGFSQGGAAALFSGLRYPQSLGGVLALSSYLPRQAAEHFPSEASAIKHAFFLGHGRFDPVVPFSFGQHTQSFLEARDYPVSWHAYDCDHTVPEQELSDILHWLNRRLTG